MSEADNSSPRNNNAGSRHAHPDAQSSEALATETRMRRALGLSPGTGASAPQQRPEQARARHRFVQDGGVPVVVLNHKPDADTALRERVASLEALLESERAAHALARRTLSEQHAAHQALQTRLAHAELAHTEALEAERRQRLAAHQALAELQAAPTRRAKPAEPPASAQDPLAGTPAPKASIAPATPAAPIEKPKRGRPRIHPIPEPKPVRWWTPGFKAKAKA